MVNDALLRLTGQLSGGWLNILIASHDWIIPSLQTIHILSVAVVLSGVLFINLRIAGLVEHGQPIAAILDRYLWPVTIAVTVLAVTGALLIAGEPTRAIFRMIFWIKMALIVAALGLTWSHRAVFTLAPGGAIAVAPARKLVAIVALALWLAVIVAGRWIAYVNAWPGAPS
ncbi:DUF6644 family protein [Sphingomonas sp. MMS24-J13]|uniref:DUF6644 family protein n=1 Tax=Sphingomonas sp. MMS24-J13 TaxID=3238686 RepID=UPI003851493E